MPNLARRFVVTVLLTCAAGAGLAMGTAAPAGAATVSRTFAAGADQPFHVPSGVTELSVVVVGAAGESAPNGGPGGSGARVAATLAVTPGTTLYVNVDVGGGAGGPGGTNLDGGDGGGASDIRTCSSTVTPPDADCVLTGVPATDPRLVVAGGGGGSAAGEPGNGNTAMGGDAGELGQPGTGMRLGGVPGGGGTATAGGAVGAKCFGAEIPREPGSPGAGGHGGAGYSAGGGGGAGWFGGGGAGACEFISFGEGGGGGGGGGSSLVPTGGTVAVADEPASVTISYSVADLALTTDGDLPAASHGAPYAVTLQTVGGTGAPTFAVTSGSLPPGLELDTDTGEISGTPTAVGTSTFTVTATDAEPQVGSTSREFALTVTAPDLVFTTGSQLPGASQGVPYATTIGTSGGTAPPTYAVTGGSLPAGLALAPATGAITGTPTGSGTSGFTITASDPDPGVVPATRTFGITVAPAAVPPTLPTPPTPTVRTCGGLAATIVGTAGDDVIVGTPGADVIVGLGGDDRVRGLGGADAICGGTGDDTLAAGTGPDLVRGRSGEDGLRGGRGVDDVRGGAGDDSLGGGRGVDGCAGAPTWTPP